MNVVLKGQLADIVTNLRVVLFTVNCNNKITKYNANLVYGNIKSYFTLSILSCGIHGTSFI